MPTVQHITVEYLRQCFIEKDGCLWWRTRPRDHFDGDHGWKVFNTRFSGGKAGCQSIVKGSKRWAIRLQNTKLLFRYAVVFALHRGFLPGEIDHINGNSLDDRIGNLRLATRSENNANARRRSNNSSGYKGVYLRVGQINQWQAKIVVKGKQFHLGSFGTREDAHAAYVEAAKKHFGEFANGG